MDFFGADFTNHAHDFTAGGATNQRVVDQNDALTFEQAANRVKLQLDSEIPDGLRRLDERSADVVSANQTHAEGNS